MFMLLTFFVAIFTRSVPRSITMKATGVELLLIVFTLIFTSIYPLFRWYMDRKLFAAVENFVVPAPRIDEQEHELKSVEEQVPEVMEIEV